jgi:hypothetical protein
MPDDRTVKKALLRKPDGRRKARRTKLKWLDCTENDLQSMGVKRHGKKAEDRCVSATILKQAWLDYKDRMSVNKKIVKTVLNKTALDEGLLYSATGKETHLGERTGTACHEQRTNEPAVVKSNVVECELMLKVKRRTQ